MVWEYILRDFREPLSFLPQGVLASLGLVCAGIAWDWLVQLLLQRFFPGRKRRRALGCRKEIWGKIFLLLLYGYVIIQISLLSREPGSRNEMNLVLFGTWGVSPQSRAYVIENIMMFIPFGFLMPWLISGLRAGVWCSLAGLCCCGVIEIAQKITGRGYFQVDDLAMNTLGALFGWMCWKVFDCLWKRGGKEKS